MRPMRRGAEAFWQTSDLEKRRTMYFGELLPLFTQIKDTAQKIISINQDAMVKADRDARDLSARSTRHMFVASGLGIAAALFFAARSAEGHSHPDPGAHGRLQRAWRREARPDRAGGIQRRTRGACRCLQQDGRQAQVVPSDNQRSDPPSASNDGDHALSVSRCRSWHSLRRAG